MKIGKTWVLRIRWVDRKIFRAIKAGEKIIETRALGPTQSGKNFRDIKKGDTLLFMCRNARLEKEVKKIMKFRSIDSMVAKIDMKNVLPWLEDFSSKEVESIYYGYPGYKERIKKYGIIAIWI